jgi:hypothetical protein
MLSQPVFVEKASRNGILPLADFSGLTALEKSEWQYRPSECY